MNRLIEAVMVIALCALITSPALAQPPRGSGGSSGQRPGGSGGQRPGGSPRGGPGEGGPGRAIMKALDADRDNEISADEIANAIVVLKGLDVDGDGKLTEADERSVNGARRPNRSGPRAQAPRAGRAQPPLRGRAKPPQVDGLPETSEQSVGERDERGERLGPTGPTAPADGPPGPDQFVRDAMGFDADGNGQLDPIELKKFAEQMKPPRPGPGRDR